eukprot:TRINITY_DN64425_c0_g2_i1.p1 TRINITY_DN64425_c0_g2~~TRINITY_DN64425_c0_g2_i1.p1  ORF type:complete len:268 (+),score=8.62 TRINITY_DN64425_c0_g2_i1:113-916(+)
MYMPGSVFPNVGNDEFSSIERATSTGLTSLDVHSHPLASLLRECPEGRLVRMTIKSELQKLADGEIFDNEARQALCALYDKYYIPTDAHKFDSSKVDDARKYVHPKYKTANLQFLIDGKWEPIGLSRERWHITPNDPEVQEQATKSLLARRLIKGARECTFNTCSTVTCVVCGKLINKGEDCWSRRTEDIAHVEYLPKYTKQQWKEMTTWDAASESTKIAEPYLTEWLQLVMDGHPLDWRHDTISNEHCPAEIGQDEEEEKHCTSLA